MLLGLLMVLRLGVEAQQRLVMPAALKAGDTIAVVSPSSTPDSMTVVKGCETLREWGFVPVVSPHALSNWHGFAGTADERAADMLWALRDSTVKAILCSRGGDGAVQVLQRIALNEFYNHPKWVMGFSDATALHSAEVAAGVMSIHCSMCDGCCRANCRVIRSLRTPSTNGVRLKVFWWGAISPYFVALLVPTTIS